MKSVFLAFVSLLAASVAAETKQFGTIKATESVVTSESDPTVHSWAKQPTKPSYSPSEIGAQTQLISGVNIKTVNGETVLGSGNIEIGSADTNMFVKLEEDFKTNRTAVTIGSRPTIDDAEEWNSEQSYGQNSIVKKDGKLYICVIDSHTQVDPSEWTEQSSHWREVKVGKDSFVQGKNNVAGVNSEFEGSSAHAEGGYTHAEGGYTHAEGFYTHAEGDSTHAEGDSTHAEGDSTHAEGFRTHAEGACTHTEGSFTHSGRTPTEEEVREAESEEMPLSPLYGTSAHAEGWGSVASNQTSFVWQGVSSEKEVFNKPVDDEKYYDHGAGTFNLNPVGGLAGVWIGETNLSEHIDAKVGRVNGDRITAAWRTNGVSTIHADGSWVTRTNATAGVAVTNYLCTVVAAQAKADAARDYADGKFVKFVSNEYNNKISDAYEVSVPWSFTGGQYSFLSFVEDETFGILFVGTGANIKNSTGNFFDFYAFDSSNSRLTIDNSPVVTSNMMNAVVGSTSVTNLGAVAAATNMIATVERTVNDWETYWRGDRVRLSVTNYYGNTSGELPRLRIEEFDHSTTTTVGTVQIISNFFHTVWDENDRHTNYMATTDARVNAISNNVLDAAWRQTNLQLINKAPRAWQTVTSAGEDAPPNTVWHTAPQSVFAGGTEYAHVAVGEGTICVLVDKGAPVYTDGAEGQFRFQDQSGQNYFGFDVRSSYKIGCRTDGIAVNSQTHIVSLTYDLTSATNPSILQSTNLVDWADAEVEWEQNPPEGTKVCYINCGTSPRGFYQAEIRYAGGSKFLTNMQADLMGGISASNQTLNVIQSVEPYVVSNQVMWRVKQ